MATQTTKKKSTGTKTAAKKSSTKKTTPRLHERDPKVVITDAAYALAALANDTVDRVKALPTKANELRTDAPARIKDLREQAPDKASKLQGAAKLRVHNTRQKTEARLNGAVTDVRGQVDTYREKAVKEFDSRVKTFEKTFDQKAKAGRKVAEPQVKKVLDQTANSRTQVKAAVTSLRKTADVAVDAAKEQAGNAKVQIKAAATSTKKSADTVADAGRELAS